MAPHFETAKSFADVPITEEGVETEAFLEASDGLVLMFDLLGSAIFGFVQNDMRQNLAGVRERFQAFPEESTTLEKLVKFENAGGTRVATACLIRLIRGQYFTCSALLHAQNEPNSELHTCFQAAYDEVLRHHHNFIIRGTMAVVLRAVPYRKDFYARIAQGGSIENLNAELAKWLVGLDIIVKRMCRFVDEGNFGKV
ncbi:glycolipid transfer protein [Athelia psychrophila]|uniref:Glycolipid transfer protein n=1 Tax=Athelia psychrophila TaxID=1759441 RepID=A0A166F087_9AGAM|nr:glycolipid transfer protein [Fibularhizoctonia sp. CBS 109695]